MNPIDWCPDCIKAGGPCHRPHRHARKRVDARYQAQTEQMAAEVRREVEAESAAISAILDKHTHNLT